MELRTLRYFLAVANEKNITKAADILHVTQPTLSRQLSDLERELGTVLVIRGKQSLTLTEDGVLFRQRAEDIVEMARRTEREFAGKEQGQRCHHPGGCRVGERQDSGEIYEGIFRSVPGGGI